MVLYKLGESNITGISAIDTQHKELIDRVNSLLESIVLAKGNEKVAKTIEFLESYVKIHFDTEEDYMERYNYPDYQLHKKEHAMLTNNVLRLKKELEQMGATHQLSKAVREIIGDWIMAHTKTMDMQFVPFLKDKIK